MERNSKENASTGSSGQSGSGSGSSSDAGSYGASTGSSSGSTGSGVGSESYGAAGSGSSTGGSFASSPSTEGRSEKGAEAATGKLGKAREKAGELKASLADKLEAGAEKLRQRGQSGSYSASAGSGTAAVVDDGRMAEVSNRVAGGLQHTADWIRDADVESLKSGIENQVKEHPGRTLLIAAGVGYLLGKAFRR